VKGCESEPFTATVPLKVSVFEGGATIVGANVESVSLLHAEIPIAKVATTHQKPYRPGERITVNLSTRQLRRTHLFPHAAPSRGSR
jgi:hypothetical protein